MKNRPNVTSYDFATSNSEDIRDITTGLLQHPKRISSKYLYDEKGAELFKYLATSPDYHISTLEYSILNKNIKRFKQDFLSHPCSLIELGSGSENKIRSLLATNRFYEYVTIDVSKKLLLSTANTIGGEYPRIKVKAINADYSMQWDKSILNNKLDRVVYFPGNTACNLEPRTLQTLFSSIHRLIKNYNGKLILSIDLKKDKVELERAYNDSGKFIEQINLNALTHINRIADANFDINNFKHLATFNESKKRIEFNLESLKQQSVKITNTTIPFRQGERIHTLNSYKYGESEFIDLLKSVGYKHEVTYTDANQQLGVFIFSVA